MTTMNSSTRCWPAWRTCAPTTRARAPVPTPPPEAHDTQTEPPPSLFEEEEEQAPVPAVEATADTSELEQDDPLQEANVYIAYERYDIDGVSTDFPTATFGYRFGQ